MTTRVFRRHLEAAARYEVARARRDERLPNSSESWFEAHTGKRDVLVTAPHAMAAIRHGEMRPADPGSGWLAMSLQRMLDVHTVVTNRMSPSDPNFYDDNPFKQTVAEIIQRNSPLFVLDLHTAKSDRPFHVDIGTMHGASVLGDPTLVAELVKCCANNGISEFSDNFFPAIKNQTLTKWSSQLRVPCMQIEINVSWLKLGSSIIEDLRSARVLQSLVDFIELRAPIDPSPMQRGQP
ncbi:MAG: hypothetical protein K0U93_21640 [Gammaproteobacteria bacterium]|nr:hypothetical protein [Gammaproteobacteria bacterium]